MFKLYKPFTLLTPPQQTSALGLAAICHWPEYETRYKRVYILEGDKVLASYPMDEYLSQFGIDCPECKGELSLSECNHSFRESAQTAGVNIKEWPFGIPTHLRDKLRVIHKAHCKGCRECLS